MTHHIINYDEYNDHRDILHFYMTHLYIKFYDPKMMIQHFEISSKIPPFALVAIY